MKTLHIALLFVVLLLPVATFGQTDERAKGIEFFKNQSYKEAAALLEKTVKAAPGDVEARNYLALAQIALGKFKNAEKTLETGLETAPNDAAARKSLAFVYLMRGKFSESVDEIARLRTLAPLDAESFYILGLAEFRLRRNGEALAAADESIKLNAKYANAYLLKAQAILNLWNGDRKIYQEITARYGSPVDHIGKFVTLAANSPEAPFWRAQQESLKIFAKYYEELEKTKSSADANTAPTGFKILKKPRAEYSSRARSAGVGGTVRLLVAFGADGKIENVMVLSSLGYGLDEVSIKAARKIEFEPATLNGQPVRSIRPVEYTFTIY